MISTLEISKMCSVPHETILHEVELFLNNIGMCVDFNNGRKNIKIDKNLANMFFSKYGVKEYTSVNIVEFTDCPF